MDSIERELKTKGVLRFAAGPEGGDPTNDTGTLDAEIFAVGTWNGEKFTKADLEQIAANFQRLADQLKPPLKLGHDDNQVLGQEDGQPALGWVSALKVVGDKLVATFQDVPKVVRELIRKRRYRRVSAEIYVNVKADKEKLGKALKAVALLGADIPAVSTLEDLGTLLATGDLDAEWRPFEAIEGFSKDWRWDSLGQLMHRIREWIIERDGREQADAIMPLYLLADIDRPPPEETAGYRETDQPGEHVMLTEEEKREFDQLRSQNAELQNKVKDFTDKEAQRAKDEAAAKVKDHRAKLTAHFEEAVKAQRILPAEREKLIKLMGIEDDERVLAISEDDVKGFIEARAPAPGGEQGLHSQRGPGDGTDDPSAELAEKVEAYMAEHEVAFEVASKRVLQADPELGQRYKAYTERARGHTK